MKKLFNKKLFTKSYRCLGAVCFICLFVISCQPGKKKRTKNDITLTTETVKENYHLLENPENPNCSLQLSFTYPLYSGNTDITLDEVQTLFIRSYFGEAYGIYSPEEAVKKYVEDYLRMYKELEADFKEDLENAENEPIGAWYSYYETSENEILYNANNILSYNVYFENYTGGAHGAHTTTNHVIDLTTATFVREDDIFIYGFNDKLAKLFVEEIKKQNNLENAEELEDMGYFSIDEIYPNDNFSVDEEGITYSFNEYEIAAYFVGITQIKLTWETVKDLLNPESPVSVLFEDLFTH